MFAFITLSKRNEHNVFPLHRKRFVASTYENPAGNVLPYFPPEDNKRSRIPPHLSTIQKHLTEKIPTRMEDTVFGVKIGLRETIPVDHIPDKPGIIDFLYGNLSSCKDDRLECIPIPNSTL